MPEPSGPGDALPGEYAPDRELLRRFFGADGRLLTMPTRHLKRWSVLDHIAQRFEPGRTYDEREVDAVLKAVHEDHAALGK